MLSICGCPRSGTTALTSLLNCDPRLFILQENRLLSHWDTKIEKGIFLNDPIKFELLRKKGIDPESISYPISGKALSKLMLSVKDVELIGDKLPRRYLYSFEELNSKFNNLKNIICLRDGRAVIASQIRKWNSGHRSVYTFPDVETAQQMWLRAAKKLSRISSSISNILIVRYEDSVSQPEYSLRRIYDFLNLPFNPEMLVGSKYYPTHVNTWREELPDIEKDLSDEFKHYLQLFGYPLTKNFV